MPWQDHVAQQSCSLRGVQEAVGDRRWGSRGGKAMSSKGVPPVPCLLHPDPISYLPLFPANVISLGDPVTSQRLQL